MVRQEKVGSVVDLEGAERIVRGTVRFPAEAAFGGDRLHSLRIVEIPSAATPRSGRPFRSISTTTRGPVGLPDHPLRGRCVRINGTGAVMDSPDCYYVLTSQDAYTEPTDALRVFRPRFRIAPMTKARLLRAYNDYRTFRVRMSIADTGSRGSPLPRRS